MACISPDGTLTIQARAVLDALLRPRRPEDIAAEAGLPLYRVRSSLRELVTAGLLEERDGVYGTTAAGQARLGSASGDRPS